MDILSDLEFLRKRNALRNNYDLWLWTITKYLQVCRVKGVFPFSNTTEQAATDNLFKMLGHGRRALVSFANQVGLFEKFKPFTVTTHFEVEVDSFKVVSSAVTLPIEDPTIKRWLVSLPPGPTFVPGQRSGTYTRILRDASYIESRFDIDLVNLARPRVQLSIYCECSPALSHSSGFLSRKELDSKIELQLWHPIVRTYRFNNVDTRVF